MWQATLRLERRGGCGRVDCDRVERRLSREDPRVPESTREDPRGPERTREDPRVPEITRDYPRDELVTTLSVHSCS